MSRHIGGIDAAVVLANVCICLSAVDFVQAARAVLLHKHCHDQVVPIIDANDWALLFQLQLDADSRVFLLPSAAAILAAIIIFRSYLLLQVIGTSLNVWAAAQSFDYFQNRAWCEPDQHGYELESVVLGYVLFGVASMALITVFGTFRLLRRKRAADTE